MLAIWATKWYIFLIAVFKFDTVTALATFLVQHGKIKSTSKMLSSLEKKFSSLWFIQPEAPRESSCLVSAVTEYHTWFFSLLPDRNGLLGPSHFTVAFVVVSLNMKVTMHTHFVENSEKQNEYKCFWFNGRISIHTAALLPQMPVKCEKISNGKEIYKNQEWGRERNRDIVLQIEWKSRDL